MRLTWRDAAATALVAAIVAGYLGYLAGDGMWFIDSPRWAAGAALMVGLTACGVGGSPEGRGAALLGTAKVLAAAAGILGVIAMIFDSELVLAGFIGVIVLLWITATVRHALYGRADATKTAGPKAGASTS